MVRDKDNKMDNSRNRLDDFSEKIEARWTKEAKTTARGKSDGTAEHYPAKVKDSHRKVK